MSTTQSPLSASASSRAVPAFRKILVALRGDPTDRSLIEYSAFFAAGVSRRFVRVVKGDASAEPAPQDYILRKGGREDEILHTVLDEQADLLIVGARADSSRRKLVRRLAMKSPCSVLVIPENYPLRMRGILAAVDFSKVSADALEVAAKLALQFRLNSVLGVHAYFEDVAVSYEEHEAVVRKKEEVSFHTFLSPLDLGGVAVEEILEECSSVAHAVESVAERREIDLIVMGTRGRSRSASILLGSQTEQMIQETTWPVLAVKHFGSTLPLLQALLERRLLDPDPRFG